MRQRKKKFSCARHMVINNRLVFCLIPKVANTSWKYTFRIAAGYRLDDGISINDRRRNGLSYLSSKPAFMHNRYLTHPSYMRAVFVRDPWSRVLSAYRNKIEHVHADQCNRSESFIIQAITQGKRYCAEHDMLEDPHSNMLTFGEFLRWLESCAPERMDKHWRPQHLIANLDHIHYDFIGRFERLEQDAAILCERAGLPELYTGRTITQASHASQPNMMARYYTHERIDRVARIYARDVELLGYQAPETIRSAAA